MAGSWKKIFEKIDKSPSDAPFASDWEAMNAKIDAHPNLNTSKKGGAIWWRAGLAVLIIALLGTGAFVYLHHDSQVPVARGNNAIGNELVTPNPNTRDKGVVMRKKGTPVLEEDKTVARPFDENNRSVPEQESGSAKVKPNDLLKGVALAPPMAVVENVSSTMEAKSPSVEQESANTQSSDFRPGELPAETNEQTAAAISAADNSTPLAHTLKEDGSDEIVSQGKPGATSEITVEEEGEVLQLQDRNIHSALQQRENSNEAEVQNVGVRSAPKPEGSNKPFRNGLRVTGVSMGGGYLTNYNPGFYGTGAGVDVDVQRKGLLLNAGAHYYKLNNTHTSSFVENRTIHHNYYTYTVDSTVQMRTETTWVITGPYTGKYLYDTTWVVTYDTISNVRTDTLKIKLRIRNDVKVKVAYMEIPVLAGHRFRFKRFAVDLMGGVVLNQLTQRNDEGGKFENTFGMDAILRPAVHYYFLPEWSVFGRASVRYGLLAADGRPENIYSGFQMGITYHW